MQDVDIIEADWTNPGHRSAVVEILDAYAREPIEGGRPLPEDVKSRLVDGLASHPTAFALLAFVDATPVGIAVCFTGFSTFAARPLINIHDLAVLSEYRGRGIGTALIDAVVKRAGSSGCGKITLEVRSENTAARRLYNRTGFTDPGGNPTHFLERRLPE